MKWLLGEQAKRFRPGAFVLMGMVDGVLLCSAAYGLPQPVQNADAAPAKPAPPTPVEQTPEQTPVAQTPEPTWEVVRLKLEIEPAVPGCPQAPELTTWINQLVGRTFVTGAAPVELLVHVRHGAGDALLVELLADDQTTQPALLRHFEQVLPCSELLRAAALTVSLFAKAPESPPSEAAAPAPETSQLTSTPPAGATGAESGVQPPAPAASPTPRGVAPAAEVAPTASASAQTRSTDTTVREPERELGPPTAPTMAAKAAESPEVSAVAGAAGLLAVGMNPGVGFGAGLHVGVHFRGWDLLLRGAYLASTGQRLTPEEPGEIQGSTSELFFAACPLVEAPVVLRLCGSLGPLWIEARGRGFDLDRRVSLTALSASGSVELLFPLSQRWVLGARLELLAPLAPVKYRLDGVPDASWTMWPLAPRGALSVEWR